MCICKLDPTAAIDLIAANEMRPPGMLRLGMIPAVPRDSFSPIMMKSTPSMVPVRTKQRKQGLHGEAETHGMAWCFILSSVPLLTIHVC